MVADSAAQLGMGTRGRTVMGGIFRDRRRRKWWKDRLCEL